MGPVKKITVTLRFRGDSLDPRALTERLGGPATNAAAKGAIWVTPSGAERVAETGWWRLQLGEGDAHTFEDQITQLFAALSPDTVTWRDLSARYGGNLFVGVFLDSLNEGLIVTANTAFAIGERGLSLQLDIYGDGDLMSNVSNWVVSRPTDHSIASAPRHRPKLGGLRTRRFKDFNLRA